MVLDGIIVLMYVTTVYALCEASQEACISLSTVYSDNEVK